MKKISIYRLNAVILLGILIVAVLYYGRVFFIPFFFAIILAMLVLPVSRKLENWGIKRIWATLLCLFIILLFLAAVILVIGAQAASFSEDLPQIQAKFYDLTEQVKTWIQQRFGVSPERQIEFVKQQISRFSDSANRYFTILVQSTLSIVAAFVLILLYVFFFLWQREKYKTFILQLVSAEDQLNAKETLEQITRVSGQYLVGRLISMFFLAAFYAISLSIIGLKDAVLISIIAVLPTLIPYIGAYIGALFPMVMALVTGSTGMLVPTVAVLIFAQVIDNNIIEPIVMGAKLNLNPLMTILAIVLGELIWGIPGMILFEPLFAIIRIVCSHIPQLHPFNFVMGETDEHEQKPPWLDRLKKVLLRK